MGCSRDATRCQWGRVAVKVSDGEGCIISRWGGDNDVATPALEY